MVDVELAPLNSLETEDAFTFLRFPKIVDVARLIRACSDFSELPIANFGSDLVFVGEIVSACERLALVRILVSPAESNLASALTPLFIAEYPNPPDAPRLAPHGDSKSMTVRLFLLAIFFSTLLSMGIPIALQNPAPRFRLRPDPSDRRATSAGQASGGDRLLCP